MVAVPIPLMLAFERQRGCAARDSDCPTMEDPLPATIETSGGGYALSRASRLTEVQRETTDDN